MRAKKMVYFFSALLLFSGLAYNTCAMLINNVSFNGVGVTIDLAFPDESHPNRTITHEVNITANTALTLQSFTLFVYAPINSILQHITNETVAFPSMQENQSLPIVNITIWLPGNVNGRLYCLMYVETKIDQTIQHSSSAFYTTHVSRPTLSEMQSTYNALVENYNLLNATYTALNETFTNLSAQYEILLEQNEGIIADYDSLEATFESLRAQQTRLSDDYDILNANYNSKITELGALQLDYDDLNSTHHSLQASYDALKPVYDALNKTYTDLLIELGDLQQRITISENAQDIDRIVMLIFVVAVACLIAFIIYIKRKKPEPYVVIRKETVAMKPDEKS